MSEFLSMGGYGFYVWSAYGLGALVLGALTAQSLGQTRTLRRRLGRRLP